MLLHRCAPFFMLRFSQGAKPARAPARDADDVMDDGQATKINFANAPMLHIKRSG